MRLLAISDIHNNLVAVRRMRARERNDFDAIVVAGDLGNAGAPQLFEILASFKCPVMYVYGNWDHELEYVTAPYADFHLIHLNVVTVGGFHFSDFSGCPTKWGKNPIARKPHASIQQQEGGRSRPLIGCDTNHVSCYFFRGSSFALT